MRTKIGSNMSTVTNRQGDIILYSYETPVACAMKSGECFRTSTHYSQTTTKHINKWLACKAEEKEQSFFNDLVYK